MAPPDALQVSPATHVSPLHSQMPLTVLQTAPSAGLPH
jgi:hypothetical protein